MIKGRSSSSSPGVFSFARPCHIRPGCHVTDIAHAAFAFGPVASGAGGVRVAEPVVRGVEEPLEHHWIRHTKKSHSAYQCEVAGGSSLAEP
jgi:hypothetical protein